MLGVLAAVLAALTLTSLEERLVAFGGAADAPYATGIVAAPAQPVGVAILLVATRRRLPLRAPRGSYRAWTSVIAMAWPRLPGLYLVGMGLLAGQFTPRPQFFDALADLPSGYLPPGYLGEVETTFTPLTPAATVLYEWTGVVFWAVATTMAPLDARSAAVSAILIRQSAMWESTISIGAAAPATARSASATVTPDLYSRSPITKTISACIFWGDEPFERDHVAVSVARSRPAPVRSPAS